MASGPAWYTYPRIDNFGQIDPEGDYYKPDSNVITPFGYPITALLSGVVSNVQYTSWGQTVITIRLDNPLNNAATHTVYQHMHDATVKTGDVVSAGQLIGHANYAGEGANLGFGLYSGDIYGSNPGWTSGPYPLQTDLAPGGAGLLNPVSILNEARAGQPITSGGYQTLAYGISNPLDWFNQFTALASWIGNPLRVVKLVVGALLVAIALLMLIAPAVEKTVTSVAGKAAKIGVLFA